MSKKQKNTLPKKPSFWRDDRVHSVGGLAVILFALFTLIVLIVYLFTWDTYQSGHPSPTVGNIGRRWANLLMGEYFGIAAFSVPVLLIVWGLRLIRFKMTHFYKIMLATLTGCVLFSVSLGFIFGHLTTQLKGLIGKGLGGITGDLISGWLVESIGFAGTFLLLLLLTLTWGIFASRRFMDWLTTTGRRFLQVAGLRKAPAKACFDKKHTEPDATNTSSETPPEVPTGIELEITPVEPTGGLIINRPLDEPDEPDERDETDEVDEPDEVDETNDAGEEFPFAEGELELYDPVRELSNYKKPTVDLLADHKGKGRPGDEELERNKNKIVKTLNNYNIGIDTIIATVGPTVTLYEIIPKAGIRIASIKRLEDDIALSLAAFGIRIIAPIPGKGTVGIEVPNENPDTVSMLSVIKSTKFQEAPFDLPVVLGKTISNENYVFDLAKMPHLLIAGATGQGKSVGLNAILTSLLYRKHPSEMKLVLVDPKKVELSPYAKIENHFLAKLPDSEEAIITDTQKVVYTLKSLCMEMDERYDLLKLAGVRNIREYNTKFVNRKLNPLKGHRYLPFIVLVIDEFADLIMTAGREVEEPIARLAQLARAIGIHLVIATQRPTTNIITGLIKANFPARVAFRVISGIDSRTILDTTGANQLIGRGDMLVSTGSEMIRVQCAFVDTPEVERICDYIGQQQGFGGAFLLPEYTGEDGAGGVGKVDLGPRDPLFDEAASLIVQAQQGSTSLIQRKLNLGYNRAGRLMDQLEAAGIVGPSEGSKARQVFISDFNTLDAKLKEMKT
ncbi:MAG: DNA translocase FtsK [Prevotellaceae bacterium]|jgi:S-DNA-T family DNA segregation ATPase FtsK/SpoIIIE|nr:DNA translocase FtsK [Prevotellaceae bacterium]